jgi:CheY-like chemotaxis protein
MRVLVVEDNADAREMLQVLLEMEGYEVLTAGDGPEALRQAEQSRPDAALIDLGLPGLDGCEVCRRLRGEPWGAAMFIVAQTGWGEERDRQRSAEAGFDAHLIKPVDPQHLIDVLARRQSPRPGDRAQ